MSKFIFTAIAATLLCAGVASAQSFDDRKAQMEAQKELMRLEAELRDLQKQAATASSGLPSVVSIMGMEGALVARLQLASGVVSNYREGDSVSTGLTVASITPKQVTLKLTNGKKSRAVPLEFAVGANTGPGGLPGAPGGNRPVPSELLPPIPNVPIQTPAPMPVPAQPVAAPSAVAAAPTTPGAPAAQPAPVAR